MCFVIVIDSLKLNLFSFVSRYILGEAGCSDIIENLPDNRALEALLNTFMIENIASFFIFLKILIVNCIMQRLYTCFKQNIQP